MAVWVNLFAGSTLDTKLPDGGRIKLIQETDYPWDGRIKITFEAAPEGEVSLFIRIPGWATDARLLVNGTTHEAISGHFAEVRRHWQVSDVLELSLPMEPRFVEANPLVEEVRNQIAVTRGPLVYCLESSDLKAKVRVQDVAIPRDATFTARFDKGLLGGVTVLEGTAEVIEVKPWGSELYRPFRPARCKRNRRETDPVLRMGQPREIGDVRLVATGARIADRIAVMCEARLASSTDPQSMKRYCEPPYPEPQLEMIVLE